MKENEMKSELVTSVLSDKSKVYDVAVIIEGVQVKFNCPDWFSAQSLMSALHMHVNGVEVESAGAALDG